VFEHDYAVGSFGDGCAGHDLPCGLVGKGASGSLACVSGSSDGKSEVRGGFGGAAGIAIACRAREWGLIFVGAERRGKYSSGC